MSGHYLRRRARGADWAFRLVGFAGAFLVVSLVLFRLGGLDLEAFSWTILVAGTLAACGLVLSLLGLSDAWRKGAFGGGRALGALALGVFVASPFALAFALALEHPAGNVAETASFGPIRAAAASAPAAPGSLANVIPGRDYAATASAVFGAAQSVIEASGWALVDVETALPANAAEGDLGVSGTVVAPVPTLRDSVDFSRTYDNYATLDSEEYVVAARAEMPIFAFPSDVTIRIQEEDGVTFVDMRSASPSLDRDLGQNQRFITSFLTRLDAAMELLQSVVVEE